MYVGFVARVYVGERYCYWPFRPSVRPSVCLSITLVQWRSQDSALGGGAGVLPLSFPSPPLSLPFPPSLPFPSPFLSPSLPLPPLRSRPLKYS